MQAEAPASVPPASVRPGPTDVTDRSGIGSGKNGSDDGAGVSASDTASAPPAEPTPGTSGNDEVAALDPTSGETAETTPAAEPAEPELPVTIGSERLREAALAGDTAALFEVASRYAEGRGVLLDMGTAVEWYERAAEAGSAPAQYRLGSVYEKGLGVPKDLGRAQDWYGRAAEAGNVKAMHNLAVLHAEGAGGEPDLERASELFRQAAERGVRDSQFNLAVLHARGLGVPRDLIEAYKWFSIAASSGDEESASRRDIIAAALSESDLAKAQAAAASFEPLPLVLDANEVRMPTGGWGDTQDSTSVEVQPAEDGGQTGSTLSENDLVALVQKLLTGQGYDPGPADGLLGNRTIQAIVDFQSRAGLQPTGQIDSDLVEALQASPG
jgi:localization factor PodJL